MKIIMPNNGDIAMVGFGRCGSCNLRLTVSRLALGALICSSYLSITPSMAQMYELPKQAEIKISDENNVDLLSGLVHFSVNDVSITDFSHSISSVHNVDGYLNGFDRRYGFDDNYNGGIGFAFNVNAPLSGDASWDWRPSIFAGMVGASERFFVNPDRSLEATQGGTLVANDGGQISACNIAPITTFAAASATYTRNDGTQMLIDLTKTRAAGGSSSSGPVGSCGVVTKITYPDGTIVRINTKPPPAGSVYARIQSITRNDGMQLKYRYAANGELTGVTGINNAFQACDPLADTCALSGAWPQSSYSWSAADSVLTVTDKLALATRFTMDSSHRVVGIKPPSSAVDKINYQYCSRGNYMDPYTGTWLTDTTGAGCSTITLIATSGGPLLEISEVHDRVVQAIVEGQVWTYSYPSGTYGPYYLQYRTQNPNGLESMALTTILGTGALLVVGTPKFVANYENTARNRMTSAQVIGQPSQTYTYDARGNVISDGLRTAGYDMICSNMKTCNKPNWVKDVAGNQTDFTYDPAHGGVLTETNPASANGIRPQKRFTYAQRYAWFKNASGTMTRSTEPIWKLATESFCETTSASGAGCVGGAADQVVTTYDYGPDSDPNNLLLRGKVVTADGISLRTCYRYDQYGNKISETQPLANLTSCP